VSSFDNELEYGGGVGVRGLSEDQERGVDVLVFYCPILGRVPAFIRSAPRREVGTRLGRDAYLRDEGTLSAGTRPLGLMSDE
jgi:hypothetical protein